MSDSDFEDSDFEMSDVSEGAAAAVVQPSMAYSVQPDQESEPELPSSDEEDTPESPSSQTFNSETSSQLKAFKNQRIVPIPVLDSSSTDPNTFDLDKLLKSNKNPRRMAGSRFEHSSRSKKSGVNPKVSQSIQERFYKHKSKVQEKIEKASKDFSEKEMLECSFKPNIKTSKAKRNVGEFLEDQRRFEQQRKERIDVLKEENRKLSDSDLGIHKPKINQESKKLATKSLRYVEPIHQKLYNQYKQMKDKLEKYRQDVFEADKFKPELNPKSQKITRSQSIDVLLYEDALRRKNKPAEQKQESAKLISSGSEKVLESKLQREFEQAFVEMHAEDNLNYSSFSAFLQKLHFTSNSCSQKQLVQQAWDFLAEDNKVSKSIARDFVFGVMKVEEGAKQNKLHKNFKQFYENRLQSINYSTVNKRFKSVQPEYNFKPSISKNSEVFARNKRTQRNNKDFLVNEKAEHLKKWSELKKQKSETEIKTCTFKPKTNSYIKPNLNSSGTFTGKPRTQALYEYSKQFKSKRENLAQTNKEQELQKSLGECTFRPRILKSPLKEKQVPQPKGVQEMLNRLQKAREEKAKIKAVTQIGKPYDAPKDIKKLSKPKPEPSTAESIKAPQECFSPRVNSKYLANNSKLESELPEETNNLSYSSEEYHREVHVKLPNDQEDTLHISPEDNELQAIQQFIEKHNLKGETANKLQKLILSSLNEE